jgi:hydroxyacylglutathione hydrolase
MILKYFYDDKLAQASYLVGCAATGEALVIDPMRDINPYLDVARTNDLSITHITETHIHADFVSGSLELAHATNAQLYLSDEGDENWKYAFAQDSNAILLKDRDMWMVGNIKVQVIHTPGHTPEHIAFMITDTAGANQPMGIFTGDFLFAGDVGRPDLLEEAAGIIGTKEVGARQQYCSVQKIKELPDYLQIWPGHGAGSACGKALGAVPSTTLGYEKLFNPAFQYDSETSFVDWLLEGQPEPPKYFAQMKKVNKLGSPIVSQITDIDKLSREALTKVLDSDELVIDLRDIDDYAQAHIHGTINIPMSNSGYLTYVGWLVNYDQPIYFIVPDAADIDNTITELQSIGIDNISGYFGEDVIEDNATTLPQVSAEEFVRKFQQNEVTLIDVRGKTEYDTSHINGAIHLPLGYLSNEIEKLPTDTTYVVNCASGYRSQIATTILRRAGFKDVINLNDPIAIWSQVLPIHSNT